jgi:hypothetical protein
MIIFDQFKRKNVLIEQNIPDDKLLQDYALKEGCKINLIRRVCDSTSQAADKPGLRDTMLAFLLKHMPPNSALKVLDEFMKVYFVISALEL